MVIEPTNIAYSRCAVLHRRSRDDACKLVNSSTPVQDEKSKGLEDHQSSVLPECPTLHGGCACGLLILTTESAAALTAMTALTALTALTATTALECLWDAFSQ